MQSSRVPSSAMATTMLANLNRNQQRLATLQEQVASGKQVQRPSDDPSAVASTLRYRSALARGQQHASSIADASRWLTATDTALTTAHEALARARTLADRAMSGATDAHARQGIADEITKIAEQLVQVGNTRSLGRPIFAGTAAGDAFAADGTYLGDQGTVSRTVGEGVHVEVNVVGPRAFGQHHSSDPMQGDVFQVLGALAQAVRSGDRAGVTAGQQALDTATSRLASIQVEVGARTNQVEWAQVRNEDHNVSLEGDLVEVEGVDYYQAIVDLKALEATYEVALSVTSRVVQPSLLEFLR